jgi:hypothetical protein
LEPSSKESITEVKLNEIQLRNSTIHAVTAMNAKDIGNGFESICNGLLLIKATGFLVDASICNRTADASLNSNQRSTLTSICKNEMPFDNQPYLETRQAIDPTQGGRKNNLCNPSILPHGGDKFRSLICVSVGASQVVNHQQEREAHPFTMTSLQKRSLNFPDDITGIQDCSS